MGEGAGANGTAILHLGSNRRRPVAAAVIRLDRLLSNDLFADVLNQTTGSRPSSLADACYQRWVDLAGVLAALPQALEFAMVLGALGAEDQSEPSPLAFLALGRGGSRTAAASSCRDAAATLSRLLVEHLDYAELERVERPEDLEPYRRLLALSRATELRRRRAVFRFGAASERDPVGFHVSPLVPESAARDARGARDAGAVRHLFPWVPSDDTWRRLLGALHTEGGSAALFVHGLAGRPAAPSVADGLRANLAALQQVVLPANSTTLLADALDIVRREMLFQLLTVEGETLAMRVFVLSDDPPSPALLASVTRSLDDVAAGLDQRASLPLLRGGAEIRPVRPEDVLAELDVADHQVLFGASEATAVLRTPMPANVPPQGIALSRSRTAAFTGRSGDDCLLGSTNHRGRRMPVALDGSSRFRHTYLIGQTGTGKSTLMARMALADIARGRGVGVLDPHGSLNDAVLRRIPNERIDDVVVVDVGDTDHPVGFNVLRIEETDPKRYLLARDLLVDELYAYIRRMYSFIPEAMGPMFESHFRGMLALLLGVEQQREPYIPNLMHMRLLYTNRRFLDAMARRSAGRDPVIDDFLSEVLGISEHSDHSLANMSSWITSKIQRFIADVGLRNMTCQNRMLDLADLVERRRIVLFYLRRGRFGEYASGLLASQMVTRLRNVLMQRGPESQGAPFYLYVDEFQTFADERIAELLSEARKFGLSLTLAHQFAAQLPPSILHAVIGNVGTSVLFRIGSADAAALEPLVSPIFRVADLVALDNFRAYVHGTDDLGTVPFSIDTLPLPDDGDDERADWAREHSRLAYGRPRADVEVEIDNTYHAFRGLGTDRKR